MRTTIWLGMSINGIIADKNGDEEFLSDNIWNLFLAQVHTTKSVIMGRKAYEALLKFPEKYIEELSDIHKVVLTKDKNITLSKGWKSARSPKDALQMIAKDHVATTIAGGSETVLSFLQEKLVDEVIYAIEPVIQGEGISSIAPSNIEQRLKLISKSEIDGILLLRYKLI